MVTIRDINSGAVVRTFTKPGRVYVKENDPLIAVEYVQNVKLRLWNLRTIKEVATYDLPKENAWLTPSGKMFGHLDQKAKTLTFWSVSNGKKSWSNEFVDLPMRVGSDPDDRVGAGGFAQPDYERPGGRISIDDIATGKELKTLDRPPGRPLALTFSPDGTLLAGSSDQVLQVWRVTWPKDKGKK